jgi:mono/diheme cytochrome c family protein
LLTVILSRFRYQWLFVVLMLLAVEAIPASGAETKTGASPQSIYETKCARCHGVSGKGNGMQAKMVFWMKMPDLTDSAYMHTRSDEALFQIIRGGGKTGMPAFGLQMTDREMKDLVGYVRSFTKGPEPPKPLGAAR